MGKIKYYVVWDGINPGIYTSWEECRKQVKGYEKAIYKSFATREEAEKAYRDSPYNYVGKNKISTIDYRSIPDIIPQSIAVDAACSGNPGPMEYRGVYLQTNEEIFHFGPVLGTNNIGEFLAIVHGLALLKQRKLTLPLYTDSKIALSWIKAKKCKTRLTRNEETEGLFKVIERAELWLKSNTFSTSLLKWNTKEWGEIPADFGRK